MRQAGMEVNPIDAKTPSDVLRRVGNVLIIVGLVDIAWMIYAISSGQSYSSSFNIFAVIGGFFLRKQSLRTARVVTFFAAFLLSGLVGTLFSLPLMFPLDLISTYLRTAAVFPILAWSVALVALSWILWWVYRSLSAREIQELIQSADLGRRRFWHQPRWGFAAGAALVLVLSVSIPLSRQSNSGREAVRRAQAQYGPEHRYFLSSLSLSSSSGSGTRVSATVFVYTDSSIESVQVRWQE